MFFVFRAISRKNEVKIKKNKNNKNPVIKVENKLLRNLGCCEALEDPQNTNRKSMISGLCLFPPSLSRNSVKI